MLNMFISLCYNTFYSLGFSVFHLVKGDSKRKEQSQVIAFFFITNSVEKTHSLEVGNVSASQEIPHIFFNPDDLLVFS